MNNNIASIFLIGMIVFAMGGVNLLGGINFLEPVKRGNEVQISVNVNNPTSDDMDDLSVRAIFLDIGDYALSSEFDLDDCDTASVMLSFDIPKDAYKGEHLVKIVTSNDDYYDSKYVYMNII